MGYELNFKFKEEITKGEYAEEIKEKKVKVGDPWEEVPLEQVAGKIMAQLARRNILIVDVEIYELKKSKLSYKEADDGIVIKNKKFKFDDGAAVVPVVMDEASALEAAIGSLDDEAMRAKLLKMLKPSNGSPGTALALPKNTNPGINLAGPLKYETFDPNPQELSGIQAALTPGKRYAILREESKGQGVFTRVYYFLKDDKNRDVKVPAECFVATTNTMLRFENEVNDPLTSSGRDPGIRLSYGSEANDDVPDLRRRVR
jgi:hypothetical protein